jgi:hypothetical protein
MDASLECAHSCERTGSPRVKQKIAKASTVYGCAVMVANQMATKMLTAENKPANFDTGDKAVLMPQMGELRKILQVARNGAHRCHDLPGETWMPPKTIKMVLFRSGTAFGERYVGSASWMEAGRLVYRPCQLFRNAFVARRPGETEDRPWARFDIDVRRSSSSFASLFIILIAKSLHEGQRSGDRRRISRFIPK